MRLPTPPSGRTGRQLRRLLEALRIQLIRTTTENVGLKVMSLGLAVSIWTLLQAEQVVEQRTRVRVSYDWPENLVRVDEVPRWVSITVSGPQGRVRAIERRTLSMSVDLSDAEKGNSTIDYTERPVQGLPDSLKITQITPPMTEVELDAKIKRTVRVRPAVIGEPAEGWARGSITIHPESVELEGPESVLRDISEVSTDIVNISGRTESLVADVAVKPPSSNLNPTNDAPVSVGVTVDALLDNRTFTDVPVIVDSGWTANPPVARFVTVKGPIRAINELKADRVRVMIRTPDTEDSKPQTVRWTRRNGADSLLSVLHGGESDGIVIDEVGPDSFTIQPIGAADDSE